MRQDGMGRSVEGLAKGFGTRRQCVLSSLKAQGCSLPAPHHSGHGSEKSKEVRMKLSNAL